MDGDALAQTPTGEDAELEHGAEDRKGLGSVVDIEVSCVGRIMLAQKSRPHDQKMWLELIDKAKGRYCVATCPLEWTQAGLIAQLTACAGSLHQHVLSVKSLSEHLIAVTVSSAAEAKYAIDQKRLHTKAGVLRTQEDKHKKRSKKPGRKFHTFIVSRNKDVSDEKIRSCLEAVFAAKFRGKEKPVRLAPTEHQLCIEDSDALTAQALQKRRYHSHRVVQPPGAELNGGSLKLPEATELQPMTQDGNASMEMLAATLHTIQDVFPGVQGDV